MAPTAPDAGRTFLGHYTLANPLVCWLLRSAPHLLSEPPGELRLSDAKPPQCPNVSYNRHGQTIQGPHAMVLRPGQWVCYRHEEPVREAIEIEYEPAPPVDVLRRTGEMLDYQWDPGKGRYVVAAMGARDGEP